MLQNPRQLAFLVLQEIRQRGAYADIALNRWLNKAQLKGADKRLATELVYGSTRRRRSLDAIVNQLAKKPATKQPPDLRTVLHLGLYQLRYLNIPPAVAVDTAVQLAKENRLTGLTGFVNGLLRQYLRLQEAEPDGEPLQLPDNPIKRLGILHSYPDWIIELWLKQWGEAETEKLCVWFDRPPTIDLRINPLQASLEEVESAMTLSGISVSRLPYLPQALRLTSNAGSISQLPGFQEGWWMVQDGSAQLVARLLDPQPGEVVIDACAAPGGKTTHIAELMGDRGTVWACDRSASRLKRLKQNCDRLNLQSIQIYAEDIRNLQKFTNQADRVLLDAPCSGLGTLHRHADARWRQTPETVRELSVLQTELLERTASWVKVGGILVYATCTLHPLENEGVIEAFASKHSNWKIDPPHSEELTSYFSTSEGWVKILPHQHQMDGFFMVRLKRFE